MSIWSLDLCAGWDRIGSVDTFEFSGVERWLEAGEWSASCAATTVEWSHYLNVDGDAVPYLPTDVDTVRLVRDGAIAFPGMVSAASSGSGGFERVSDVSGERWTWSGSDLWGLLSQRIVFPDPTSTTWALSHDVRTGVASSVVAAYLYNNAGLGALVDRRIPGFTIADQVAGETGQWSARLVPLSDLVQRICTDAEIGCWLTVSFEGAVTATVGGSRDLSERYVIADQGDFSTVKMRTVPASVTWTLAGGQGVGTARVFRTSTTPAVGLERIEQFSDQASLSTTQELQASATANTRLGAESFSVYGEVTDELAVTLRYGEQLQLGDLISIQVDGVRHKVPVTSARFEISADRQVVRPILGTATPDALRGLIRDVAGLADRFNRDIA